MAVKDDNQPGESKPDEPLRRVVPQSLEVRDHSICQNVLSIIRDKSFVVDQETVDEVEAIRKEVADKTLDEIIDEPVEDDIPVRELTASNQPQS